MLNFLICFFVGNWFVMIFDNEGYFGFFLLLSFNLGYLIYFELGVYVIVSGVWLNVLL